MHGLHSVVVPIHDEIGGAGERLRGFVRAGGKGQDRKQAGGETSEQSGHRGLVPGGYVLPPASRSTLAGDAVRSAAAAVVSEDDLVVERVYLQVVVDVALGEVFLAEVRIV